MRQYLLDTNVLSAYLQGRPGALSLAKVWIHNQAIEGVVNLRMTLSKSRT